MSTPMITPSAIATFVPVDIELLLWEGAVNAVADAEAESEAGACVFAVVADEVGVLNKSYLESART